MPKNRKESKNQRFKEMYRDRLKRIKRGQEAPETVKEWAIWHKGNAMRNAAKLKVMHNHAAINKPSTMAGKIVVIPPKP
jgi:hypothetical protein